MEGLGYGGAGPCSGAELAGRLRLESGGCGEGRMRRRVPRGQIKGGDGDFGVWIWERPRRDPRRGSRVVCASAGGGGDGGRGRDRQAGPGCSEGRGATCGR